MNESPLTPERVEQVLGQLPALRIGVFGDLFLDRYLDIDDALTEPSLETGLDAYHVEGVRSYPGAVFVSAGGYHHHIGMNTWTSAGGSPPPEGSRGLDWYEVVLPDAGEVARESERLEAEGARVEGHEGGVLATDPSGNRVLLSSAG